VLAVGIDPGDDALPLDELDELDDDELDEEDELD
jgi:hypothetical protein